MTLQTLLLPFKFISYLFHCLVIMSVIGVSVDENWP
jgi:hypothetical protein